MKISFRAHTLLWSDVPNQPTMIAESTPFGGIDMDTEESRSFQKMDPWDRWFSDVLSIIDKYDISMWCYINCAWDQQPMWHGIGFGETRLSTNDAVMEKWRDLVIKGEGGRRFLFAGSLENCGEQEEENTTRASGQQMPGSLDMAVGSNNQVDSGVLVFAIATCAVAILFYIFWFFRPKDTKLTTQKVKYGESLQSERGHLRAHEQQG